MKNKFTSIAFLGLAAALCSAPSASAQTITLTPTTLSSAQAQSDRVACLTSNSSVLSPTTSNEGSILIVDKEVEQVQGVTAYSASCFSVIRFTAPVPHNSGVSVYVGPQNYFYSVDPRSGEGGTCTLSALYTHPYINMSTGDLFRCISSTWVKGKSQVTLGSPYTAFTTLSPSNSIAINSTSQAAGTTWFSQILVPANATLTGACVLNGATVGTDKYIVAVYDSSGVLVANSATAGTTTATASKYQCIAFTATANVYGPGAYFVAIQTNGTTDNFATYAANSAPTNYGTNNLTGTFGTLTAITPTVTFTANKGPIMMVY